MEKKRNPNFIYIKSDLLHQEVAVSKKTGWVFCEDGVKYSPAEVEVVYKASRVLDMATHQVKKIIGGEIVGYEPEASDKGKPVENGGGAESQDSGGSPGGEAPSINEAGAENRNELFDIY